MSTPTYREYKGVIFDEEYWIFNDWHYGSVANLISQNEETFSDADFVPLMELKLNHNGELSSKDRLTHLTVDYLIRTIEEVDELILTKNHPEVGIECTLVLGNTQVTVTNQPDAFTAIINARRELIHQHVIDGSVI